MYCVFWTLFYVMLCVCAVVFKIYILNIIVKGEEGQPQQFLVRATFSPFSRPSHLEILVLIKIFFMCPILEVDNINFMLIFSFFKGIFHSNQIKKVRSKFLRGTKHPRFKVHTKSAQTHTYKHSDKHLLFLSHLTK